MAIDSQLLELLACPQCKGELEPTAAEDGLICHNCAVVYPVEDGIPIMLIEEAIALSDWQAGKRRTAE
ncbi:MAG: Trm112 family protein [Desulfohalobium sp.]